MMTGSRPRPQKRESEASTRKRKPRFYYAVLWLNVRDQRRVRWFEDYNRALNFRALFPYERSAMFKTTGIIGL